MNYFRSIFQSVQSHATRAINYVHTIVFGDPSINNEETHNLIPTDQDVTERSDANAASDDDVFYDAEDFITESTALKNGVTHYTIKTHGITDPKSFLKSCKPTVLHLMKPETKVYMKLSCTMKKINPATNTEEIAKKGFRSSNLIIYPDYMEDSYNEMVTEVLEEFAKYQMDGSGWSLKSTDELLFSVAKWMSMRGSSYIPLLTKLKNKKALINMKNQDQECFKWSVTRALHPVDNSPQRITKLLKQQANEYNWDGISFPTSLKEIERFERFEIINDVSINVMAVNEETDDVYPLQGYRHKSKTQITLMLITDVNVESDDATEGSDDNEQNSHYVVVKDISKLLYRQTIKKHGKRHYCLTASMDLHQRTDSLSICYTVMIKIV